MSRSLRIDIDIVLIVPTQNEYVVPDLEDVVLYEVFHNINIGINLVHKLIKVVINTTFNFFK